MTAVRESSSRNRVAGPRRNDVSRVNCCLAPAKLQVRAPRDWASSRAWRARAAPRRTRRRRPGQIEQRGHRGPTTRARAADSAGSRARSGRARPRLRRRRLADHRECLRVPEPGRGGPRSEWARRYGRSRRRPRPSRAGRGSSRLPSGRVAPEGEEHAVHDRRVDRQRPHHADAARVHFLAFSRTVRCRVPDASAGGGGD